MALPHLEVMAAPVFTRLSSGTLTCQQTSVTVTAVASEANRYQLSNGQQNASGQFVVAQPGTYTLTASQNSGCQSSMTITVNSDTTPPNVPALSGVSLTSYAGPGSVSLETFVTASPGHSLTFSDASGPLLSPNVNLSIVGKRTYAARQRSANGCLGGPTTFTLVVVPLLATEPTVPMLSVGASPNPIAQQRIRAIIRGAEGHALTVWLLS